MNKRQAYKWIDNNFFGDLSEDEMIENLQSMVNRIYKPMEKIVCLCGSTKFKEAFEKANRDESLKGNIVLTVAQFSHADNLNVTKEEKEIFNKVHLQKIQIANEVLVLNVDGYIGESTRQEIDYAIANGKKIRYLENN